MLDNVTKASELYLKQFYSDNPNVEMHLEEVKGYLTSNVYKMTINSGGSKDVVYLKESSNLKKELYNTFIKNEYINTDYVYKNYLRCESFMTVKPIAYYDEYNVFFMQEIIGKR